MQITLEDKYIKIKENICYWISSISEITISSKKLDEKLNLNTSGFISGYRGSPLGVYDKACGKLKTI